MNEFGFGVAVSRSERKKTETVQRKRMNFFGKTPIGVSHGRQIPPVDISPQGT